MKYVIICLAVLGFGLFASCGSDDDGGPHCVTIETCDPACNVTTQWCDGTTCKDYIDCEPACATDGTEYCDMTTGDCVATCDPACNAATQYCDNGTCVDKPVPPVCDPVCVLPEVCVD